MKTVSIVCVPLYKVLDLKMSNRTYRLHKPSSSSILEPAEMTSPRRGAHDAVWRLGDLLVRQRLFRGDLAPVSTRHESRYIKLTGSSSAWRAKKGIRIANSESTEEASR